ncbi:S1 family peptidase [Photorhabdus caribbeanensis]|uniref:S1 family peptidase n=1 Tax=Photorhabdus caribbeanensis TaxID=1004165 RepID=UPI001BD4AFBC|nr:serine protease [Photorhabdus caribbeanensis]MBS9425007.1 serine protease [Photorhabdus caribbeanensis]
MKEKLLFIIAFISTLSFSLMANGTGEIEIINGEPAEPGEFLFYSALNTKDGNIEGHHCGSILISKRWVLTAAHCVEDNNIKSKIYVGLERYKPTPIYKDQVDIEKIIIHPNWFTSPENTQHKTGTKKETRKRGQYDIALIKLNRDANSNTFAKLNGINETIDLPIGTELTVIGFGRTESVSTPNMLMKTNEYILEDKKCIEVPPGYPDTNYDPKINICSGNPNGGVGGGDSGGPLMIKTNNEDYVISGLVSRSLLKPAEQFTKVSFFNNWILETVKNN